MRLILLIFISFLLQACSTVIEHQLASAKYNSPLLPIAVEYVYQEHQMCDQRVNHEDHCLRYFDLDKTERIPNFAFSFDYEFLVEGGEKLKLKDDITFSLLAPSAQAPLAVIFPGYSMHAADMMSYAAWLNDLGFFPVIADGPTYHQLFDFGQRYSKVLADNLAARYPGRPALLLGYSMGASVLDIFVAHYPDVKAVIAVAPMLNIQAAGETVFARARANNNWLKLIPKGSISNTLEHMLSKQQLDAEDLHFSQVASRLNKPLQVYSAKFDWLAPSRGIAASLDAEIEHYSLDLLRH